MAKLSNTKLLTVVAALTLGTAVPALAQDFQDPSYGPRDRRIDEFNQPYELDGFEAGREGGPFITNEDLGIRAPRGGGFELEGPPIGPSLPVIPDAR